MTLTLITHRSHILVHCDYLPGIMIHLFLINSSRYIFQPTLVLFKSIIVQSFKYSTKSVTFVFLCFLHSITQNNDVSEKKWGFDQEDQCLNQLAQEAGPDEDKKINEQCRC